MKKENTLLELLIGIVAVGVVIQIVCIFISSNYLYDAIGLWIGIGISCFSAIHMKRFIEDSLDLGETGAVKHIRIGYATRMVVAALVIGLVVYFKLGNYITLLISTFSLKIAAYLQPVTHRLFKKEG